MTFSTTASGFGDTSPATTSDEKRLCPLDGSPTEAESMTDYLVCTRCREVLLPSETVSKAGPDTWAAYLSVGETDTQPEEAPLSRLTLTNHRGGA